MVAPLPLTVLVGPTAAAFLSAVALVRYAEKGVNRLAFFGAVLGFTLSLSIVTLIPYDVWQSLSLEGEPTFMHAGWDAIYWSTSLLCWFLCPVLIEFEAAGDFTTEGRLRRALRRNVVWYVSYISIGIVALLAILVFGVVQGSLGAWLIAASNAWGLLMLTVLMGFGLVAVPRHLWRLASPEVQLASTYRLAVASDEARLSAQFELQDVMMQVRGEITTHDAVLHDDRYAQAFAALQATLEKCEVLQAQLSGKRSGQRDMATRHRLVDPHSGLGRSPLVDQSALLAHLSQQHCTLKTAVLEARRTSFRWTDLVQRCMYFEDLHREQYEVAAHAILQEWSCLRPHHSNLHSCFCNVLSSILVFWMRYLRARLYRAYGFSCAVLSFVIVLGQLTMFSQRSLSLLALLFRSQHGFMFTQVFCMVPLGYMVLTAFWSILRLRIAGWYGLYPGQNTDAGSLLWVATITARLATPLCYHFLLLVRVEGTSFQALMGQMNVVPVVGDSFNQIFPCIIGFLCITNYFNLYSRLLQCLALGSLEFEWGVNVVDDEDPTGDGKRLVERERRKRDEQNMPDLAE